MPKKPTEYPTTGRRTRRREIVAFELDGIGWCYGQSLGGGAFAFFDLVTPTRLAPTEFGTVGLAFPCVYLGTGEKHGHWSIVGSAPLLDCVPKEFVLWSYVFSSNKDLVWVWKDGRLTERLATHEEIRSAPTDAMFDHLGIEERMQHYLSGDHGWEFPDCRRARERRLAAGGGTSVETSNVRPVDEAAVGVAPESAPELDHEVAPERSMPSRAPRRTRRSRARRSPADETDAFWSTIEASRAAPEREAQVNLLRDLLVALPPDEIVAFQRELDTRMSESRSVELWGAAYLISGGCSDDGFEDFRYWLIAQGREVFERALENPDSLAEIEPSGTDAERYELMYVSGEAYAEITGDDLPEIGVPFPPPISVDFDFDDEVAMRSRYPRLHAAYVDR